MIKNQLEKILGFTVEATENLEFGDYTANIAMVEYRKMAVATDSHVPGGKKEGIIWVRKPGKPWHNTRELAEDIVVGLKDSEDLKRIVDRIEVAGPGFINFWLKRDVLVGNLIQIGKEKEGYGKSDWGNGKTVVIDYSSPNIAKRFSIGHLRSTIIGQALYNLYKFGGWNTVGDNHLGDWGTQFGVLIYMVERENLDPTKLTVNDWEKLYVDFHKELETKEELKTVAAEAFKRLENGDTGAKKIWQAALKTSLAEYDRIYDLLGVKIDYAYGESSYEDQMPAAIEEAKKKGIVVKSEGAWVIEFDKKYNLPSNVLVKSNGATTYLTRDLALLFFRKEKWNPDLQIFEVGSEQSLYFRQVFAMAEMMGLFNLDQMKHMAHGLIRFEHGKMSTRKGLTIKLEDVLDEAIERAKKLGNKDLETAKAVGIGAVKYFDLSHQPSTDIIFDWEKMMAMEGNSGPYLQYTVARTNSVISKAKKMGESKMVDLNIEELSILRSLIRFSEVVAGAARNYSPNLLTNYLYDLASRFNTFYNKDKIIGSDNEDFRLALTEGTGQVLKNGLKLLGIGSPEKM